MKKIIIVLLILSSVVGYFYTSNYFYEKGNKYFEEGKYDLAVNEYEKSVKLMPNQNMIYYYLSESYFEKEDYDNTIKYTTEFINKNIELENKININALNENNIRLIIEQIDSNYNLKTFLLEVYKNRGYSYFSKNDYIKSIEDYKKAILINENIKASYKEIYDYYSKSKDLKKLIYFKNKLNDIDNHLFQINNYLGTSFLTIKNYDFAKIAFNKSLEYEKDNYEAYLGLGGIGYMNEDYEKAINYFLESLKLYDKSKFKNSDKKSIEELLYNSYENLVYIYFNKNDYENSLLYINKYLTKKPENQDIISTRGVIYYEKQDYKKALNDFDKLSKYNLIPTDKENLKIYKLNSYHELALNYINNEDYESALVYINKYLEIEPYNYDMLRAKSWLSVETGKTIVNTYTTNNSKISNITIPTIPITNSNTYYVDGYYKKDGTYTSGHYKTKPNNTKSDNLGCLFGNRCN